jgi:hypothetical protein
MIAFERRQKACSHRRPTGEFILLTVILISLLLTVLPTTNSFSGPVSNPTGSSFETTFRQQHAITYRIITTKSSRLIHNDRTLLQSQTISKILQYAKSFEDDDNDDDEDDRESTVVVSAVTTSAEQLASIKTRKASLSSSSQQRQRITKSNSDNSNNNDTVMKPRNAIAEANIQRAIENKKKREPIQDKKRRT